MISSFYFTSDETQIKQDKAKKRVGVLQFLTELRENAPTLVPKERFTQHLMPLYAN